jgi:hypothetical protein
MWFGLSRFDEIIVLAENSRNMPAVMKINGNFPNPFNPSTTIEFSLDTDGFVTLDIYNISGQKIKTVYAKNVTAGVHSVLWDGTDENGVAASSGIYFCRLMCGNHIAVRRMALVR